MICAVCNRRVRVTKAATLARHRDQYGHVCPNSGSEQVDRPPPRRVSQMVQDGSRTGWGLPEGCVCGHGAYNHGGGYRAIGRILGEHSRCIRCSCMEFRRERT